jgi:hypothetical protein
MVSISRSEEARILHLAQNNQLQSWRDIGKARLLLAQRYEYAQTPLPRQATAATCLITEMDLPPAYTLHDERLQPMNRECDDYSKNEIGSVNAKSRHSRQSPAMIQELVLVVGDSPTRPVMRPELAMVPTQAKRSWRSRLKGKLRFLLV